MLHWCWRSVQTGFLRHSMDVGKNEFPTHYITFTITVNVPTMGQCEKIVHNFLMSTEFRFDTRLYESLTWHKWGGSSLLWLTRVDVTDDVEVVDPLDLRLPLFEHFALLDDVTLLDISAILFTMDYKRKNSFNTKQQQTTKGLFTPSAALTFALTLALTLERNTLVSIAPSTPSISININTSVKIELPSGPIQKRQH